jgi:hypothetical protein
VGHEQAEKHWRRAKDATRLLEAVEQKLAEQRKFVLWWDGQGQHGGDRRSRLRTSNLDRGDFGLDSSSLHRWRTRLKAEPRRFVLWWKSIERRGGQSSRPATLANLTLDKHTVERWTIRLKAEKTYGFAVARAMCGRRVLAV